MADEGEKKKTLEWAHEYPMPWWLRALRMVKELGRIAMIANGASLLVIGLPLMAVVELDVFSLPLGMVNDIDAFARYFLGTAVLAGTIGLGAWTLLADEFLMAGVRRRLDGFADDKANHGRLPVEWQRLSYSPDRGAKSVPGAVGAGVLVALGLFLVWGTIATWSEGDRLPALGAAAIGVPSLLAGVAMFWGRTRRGGRAAKIWGGMSPPPLTPRTSTTKEPRWLAEAKRSTAPFTIVGTIGIVAFSLAWLVGRIGLGIVQPCQECAPRDLTPSMEETVGRLFTVASWASVISALLIVVALVGYVLTVGREHAALLRATRDPDAPPAPWGDTERILLREAPYIEVSKVAALFGVLSTEVGITGFLLGDRGVFSGRADLWWQFVGVGVLLIAIACVAWFTGRRRFAAEREEIIERWAEVQ